MEASRYADSPPATGGGPSTLRPSSNTPTRSTSSLKPTAPTFEPSTSFTPPPAAASSFSQPAPTLAPAPAPAYTSLDEPTSMDEFAQTRAPDDLFDDDFTPVPEPTPVEQPPTPVPAPAEPVVNTALPDAPSGPSSRGQGRGTRGGRGDRGGRAIRGRGGRRADTSQTEKAIDSKVEVEGNGDGPNEPPKDSNPPTRVEAVKGDRTATGGIKKPKLTDTELASRLASIKLKNASLLAAHARAEADEASFQRREVQEQAKREEEKQHMRRMEGERERNRMRKLRGMGGREWDEGKEEEREEEERRRGGGYRRGAHGGVVGGVGSHGSGRGDADLGEEYPIRGDTYRGRGGRGGGDRGRGSGRGRGRGGPFPSHHSTTPNPKAEADFPSLPASTKSSNQTPQPPSNPPPTDGADDRDPPRNQVLSPVDKGRTWADQMEGDGATAAKEKS
ncbi:MAG: hypothetical protein M1817_003183 [Caeruleum heppii]|nr:MAG: hypothetical protein M1817_003183 [Caeruleum heppii]